MSFRPLNSRGLRRLEDVTGDGFPDMLVHDESLQVYPSTGPGTFGPPIAIAMTGVIRCVALGNIDADATHEIAVIERTTTFPIRELIAWYDWNGAAFVRSAESSASGSLSSEPVLVAALDLEGDGDTDLVYGRSYTTGLRVVPTAGGAPGPVSAVPLPIGERAYIAPHTCDLVGGGSEDLMVAVESDGLEFALVPVLNQGGVLVPGAPQLFTADSHYVTSSNFRSGDWDGDGDSDVIYYGWQEPAGTTEGIVAFFENDGANGFGSGPVVLGETNDAVGGSQFPGSPVEVTDLDGDGRLDIVLPRSVQFGRGRFEPTLVEITDTFFGPYPIALFDLEGDGDLDLFLDGGFGSSVGSVALNDAAGAFETGVYQPNAPPGRELLGFGGIGDFSGDGRPDLLGSIWIPPTLPFDPYVFDEMRLYANDGLGGFSDAGHASDESMTTAGRNLGLTADLDRDGDLDLIGRSPMGGGYWPNRGRGRFQDFEVRFGCCATPSAVGDLDGDGSIDVVTISSSPATITAWINRTPGHIRRVGTHVPAFDAVQIFSAAQGSFDSESVTLADHDLDGDLDLAFADGQLVRLFVNNGTAVFAAGAVLSSDLASPGPDPQIRYLVFEDLDADGNVDVLAGADFGNDHPRAVLVFRGLGNGTYTSGRPYAGGVMGPAGDLDGDGDLDLSGAAIVRSLRHDGPGDGRIRQYGLGTPGSGEAAPVLGAKGPLRSDSGDAEIRLRSARGGAPFALFYSFSAGTGPSVPYPGSPTLLGEPIYSDLHVAQGAPGVAGAGTFDLDLGPMLIDLVGLTLYFQAGVVDPEGADGFALSNGLELTFGF